MPVPIGLTMPLAATSGAQGALAFSVTPQQATLYNMKSLIMTNWGERPAHFYLGCNLIEFLFGPLDAEVVERVIGREVNFEAHRDLIDEAVEALRADTSGGAAANAGVRQ